MELDESPATQSNLLSVLQRNPATLGTVDHEFGIFGAAISPDGKLMAIGDDIGNVVVYDAATRRPLGQPYRIESGIIQNVRFSPDGDTLAVSFMDRSVPELSGVFDLIDPRSGERRLRLRLPPLQRARALRLQRRRVPAERPRPPRAAVHGASPDGPASPMYLVDGETGALKDRLQVGRYASHFYATETADSRHVFVTSLRDNRTWEIDPEPLSVVRSWPVGDYAGAVSPDGRVFALGSESGAVRLLDLGSGRIRPLTGGHDGRMFRMRFTPDGRTLVTAGRDGQVLAWDVERGTVAQRFAGHSGAIDGLDLTRDGRTLITGSVDRRAVLWDLAGDRRLDRRFPVGRRFKPEFTPRGIAVSPDGRTLAVTHDDGAVDLIDTSTLRRRRVLRALDATAVSVDFSPDGRLLAVTGLGGRITLWNARTLARAGELEGMRADSPALAFSPDGKLLAAAEADPDGPFLPRPLRVWDVRTRTLTAFRGQSALGSVAFSPDGELIAAAAGRLGHPHAQRGYRPPRQAARHGRGPRTPSRSRRTASCSSSGSTTAAGSCSPRTAGSRSAVRSRVTPGASRPPSSHATVARSSPPPPTGPRCSGTSRPRGRSDRRSSSRRARSRRPRSAPTARVCSRSPPVATASASSCHGRPGSATPASSRAASSLPPSGRKRCLPGPIRPSARAPDAGYRQ